MSKIICDVCGTSYPETATQCPICGCARPGEVRATVNDNNEAPQTSGYTHVKGGRFSKSNVRKRNKAMLAGAKAEASVPAAKDDGSKNKWLLITAAVLLLAVITVIIYIFLHFFDPFGSQKGPEETDPPITVTDPTETEPSGETEPSETEFVEVPCTVLLVTQKDIQFGSVGEEYYLDVTPGPVGTTDTITYASADEGVATVDADGKITAVGSGETLITITCGAITEECKVTCNIETEPSIDETDPPEETDPPVELKLNRSDFTLFSKGSSWDLYSGELDASKISWRSSNTAVVTVTNGKVVAVGPGRAVITAEYNGSKATCVVYCSFSGTTGTGGGITEEGSGSTSYKISHTDVTIKIGETFSLTLKDESGNVQSVQWTVVNSEICSVSGNTVKGLAVGKTDVKVTYGGTVYSCIVRVISA